MSTRNEHDFLMDARRAGPADGCELPGKTPLAGDGTVK
jgi:hypothetical protein